MLNTKLMVIEINSYQYNKIRPYLKDIINYLKNSDTWKIQLTIANNFVSFIDNDKEHEMHSKTDNIEMIINPNMPGPFPTPTPPTPVVFWKMYLL